MATIGKPNDLPDSFKERCPMCGCKDLEWGYIWWKRGGFFEPTDKSKRQSIGNRLTTTRRYPTAVCQDCGYMIILHR